MPKGKRRSRDRRTTATGGVYGVDRYQRQRDTRIAETRRTVRRELDGLLYQPRAERSRDSRAGARPITGVQEPKRPKPEKVKPQKQEAQKETLRLDENKQCKAKPKRNKGDGSSRSFVPWCK